MIKADFHVHSDFSIDCTVKAERQIERAIDLGLDYICITDHCDMNKCKEKEHLFDIETYVGKISELKEKYKKQITVLCGVEMGLQPALKARIDDYINSYNFDFIIGSSHAVKGIDVGYDLDVYFSCKSEKEAYREYFEAILENVKAFSNYNVYGHLDFVVRYGPNKNKYFDFNDYKDVFEQLLKIIIENGKGIEINTAGLRKNLGYPHPHKDILKLYKDLGGEIITIGSDAHLVEHVGCDFEEIPALLKSLGFKYYAVFEKQKTKFLTC